MLARQTVWAVTASLMSSTSTIPGDRKGSDEMKMVWREQWIGITTAPAIPRLSWEGKTVYSHAFYSPSAEAGYYAALAIALLFEAISGAEHGVKISLDDMKDSAVCGSFPVPNARTEKSTSGADVDDADCSGPALPVRLT